VSCCALFLYQQTSEAVFFLPSQKYEWDEAKKIAYCSSFPHFFLPSMQNVVSEAILSNIFYKIA
jgi:hypothetical protein